MCQSGIVPSGLRCANLRNGSKDRLFVAGIEVPDTDRRFLSAYPTRLDAKLWVITEWERIVTTHLLSEENRCVMLPLQSG